MSVGSSSKPSHPSLPLDLGVHRIQEYFNKKRGKKRKYIKPQEEKARREQQTKKMRVTVRTNLVVGYWELVPMESGSNNSSEQDTATVTKELEEPVSKQKKTLWCKEENWRTMKKALERRRNPAVNRVCDEDPVTRMTVINCLQSIGSRPIIFENPPPWESRRCYRTMRLSMLKI